MQACSSDAQSLTMLVGTYTNGNSVGIYTYRFNTDDLTAQPLCQVALDNPSYLALSKNAKYVYAVSESGGNSAVNAFAFDKSSGLLQFLNKRQIESGPCYILYHDFTQTVITANYGAGSVSIVKIAPDGSLTEQVKTIQYAGQSAHPSRQTRPHIHCIMATPDNKTIYATDLGTDQIHKIEITKPHNATDDLSTVFQESSSFTLEPGSGPRHIILNKNHSHAYIINELSGMVSVLAMDAENNFTPLQYIIADTLHAGGSADIHLSPDEKFLYASTRLKGDGVAIFSVNDDKTITRIGFQPTGKHPRNFAITPDGKRMLVACLDDNVIQIFNINKKSGLLTDTGKTILVDQPVCIKLIMNYEL